MLSGTGAHLPGYRSSLAASLIRPYRWQSCTFSSLCLVIIEAVPAGLSTIVVKDTSAGTLRWLLGYSVPCLVLPFVEEIWQNQSNKKGMWASVAAERFVGTTHLSVLVLSVVQALRLILAYSTTR